MNFDVNERTILYVRHGSHAYGLNTPESDEDFKGVCIPPKEFFLGFLNVFEQSESMASKSPGGVDSVVYSLQKFARLAADCNPNIIEVLHVDDSDVIKCDAFGEELRNMRDAFISKKAKHTFSGYAHSQLKRIKTHRSWLIDPPKSEPTRKEFGLSETMKISPSELGAFEAAMEKDELSLPRDVMSLFLREREYNAKKAQFDQYTSWKKSRNPKRAELEARHGYDTKHACHLVRLMRMCSEILSTGKVNVKRTNDREELLAIRGGWLSYDELIAIADSMEDECNRLYETSTLRREPDRRALDAAVVYMTERYLSGDRK